LLCGNPMTFPRINDQRLAPPGKAAPCRRQDLTRARYRPHQGSQAHRPAFTSRAAKLRQINENSSIAATNLLIIPRLGFMPHACATDMAGKLSHVAGKYVLGKRSGWAGDSAKRQPGCDSRARFFVTISRSRSTINRMNIQGGDFTGSVTMPVNRASQPLSEFYG